MSLWPDDVVRDSEGAEILEALLVSAITALLGIRAFLALTGYPQLGGDGLHIAHMLWGGALMLGALILLTGFWNPSVRMLAGGNPKKSAVKINIHALDDSYMKTGEALKLNYLGTSRDMLIFRPEGLRVEAGQAYWCEISLDGGATIAHRYVVQFM